MMLNFTVLWSFMCILFLSCELQTTPLRTDHAVCPLYLLVQQVPVQHHLQCVIQLQSVKLKQGSPECFLIPRNSIALWPSSATFSVPFPFPLLPSPAGWQLPSSPHPFRHGVLQAFIRRQADGQQTASSLPPLPAPPSVVFYSASRAERTNKWSINEESIWNTMTGNRVALPIWGPKRRAFMQCSADYTAPMDIRKSSSVSIV